MVSNDGPTKVAFYKKDENPTNFLLSKKHVPGSPKSTPRDPRGSWVPTLILMTVPLCSISAERNTTAHQRSKGCLANFDRIIPPTMERCDVFSKGSTGGKNKISGGERGGRGFGKRGGKVGVKTRGRQDQQGESCQSSGGSD